MSEAAVEAIILAINALGCGILLFVSGVAQKIMNDMEPLEFKKFMNLLGRAAMSDPFTVAIATIPLFAIVYYFVAFGFAHGWFAAGIVIWMIGASITKITNLPIYNWLGKPENADLEELREKRRMLGLGNASRVDHVAFRYPHGVPVQRRRNCCRRCGMRHYRLSVAVARAQIHANFSIKCLRAIGSFLSKRRLDGCLHSFVCRQFIARDDRSGVAESK